MYNLLEFIKEKRALFLLSLIAAALFTVYITQSHLKVLGEPTENQSSCKQAQDLEIGKEPDPERVNSITSLLENTTKDLKNAHNDYKASSNGERKDKGEKLKEMASTRKTLFVDAMRINPNDTLAFLLTEEEKKDISDLDGSCIEKETTVEGTLEVLHADFIDKTSVTYYTIVTDSGERINIHPAKGLKEGLISGKRIKVRGVRIDNDLLFDGTSQDGLSVISQKPFFLVKPALAAIPESQGVQQTVVLLANYQNTQQPNFTKEMADDLVFRQTKNFYEENSFGKTSMAGATFGWYSLPISQTCDAYQTQNEAIKAADPNVNFTQYGRLIIVAPFGPGCSWAGMATLGKTSVTTDDGVVMMSTSWIVSSYFDLHTVGHEFGHNLGSHHASFLNCGSSSINYPINGCSVDEYGDFYDIMGSSNWQNGHLNGHHKEYIGWLDEGVNLQTVTSSGSYTVVPIATSSAGLKTLKIQRDMQDYLYVEYRQPIGFDADLVNVGGDVFAGALLHTLQYSSKTWLLDTSPPADRYTPSLQPGNTFTDPATGTKVTVTDKTSTSLTANVTLGKSDFTAPTVTITEPLANASVSGTITIKADASDASGIKKVEFYKPNSFAPFFTDYDAPYSATLDTAYVPNGQVRLSARAYDKAGDPWNVAGNIGYAFVDVTVANQDPTPPTISITSPANNSYLRNPVQVKASASDNVGIYKVEFWIDTQPWPTIDTQAPYELTVTLSNDPHTVTAKAFDFVGNTSSASVAFTVDDLSPTVSITNPANGATVQKNKNITITATASDNTAVAKVEFAVNGTIRCTDTTSPYSCVWKVPNTSGVTYAISAKAYDPSGNFNTATITVKSK